MKDKDVNCKCMGNAVCMQRNAFMYKDVNENTEMKIDERKARKKMRNQHAKK